MLEKEATLKQIESNIKICRKCRLCEKATNAVPGEGDINAKIVFVGEAPGKNEALTGRPFCGRAGQILDFCRDHRRLKSPGLRQRIPGSS